MEKRQAFLYGFIAAMVAGVVLGVSGFIYLNAQENRSKDKQQFEQCIQSGGSYVKTYEPMCIK